MACILENSAATWQRGAVESRAANVGVRRCTRCRPVDTNTRCGCGCVSWGPVRVKVQKSMGTEHVQGPVRRGTAGAWASYVLTASSPGRQRRRTCMWWWSNGQLPAECHMSSANPWIAPHAVQRSAAHIPRCSTSLQKRHPHTFSRCRAAELHESADARRNGVCLRQRQRRRPTRGWGGYSAGDATGSTSLANCVQLQRPVG
jgi:hypothetical protein